MSKLSSLALNDEGFAFDPSTGDSFVVNETGQFILKGLTAEVPAAEIINGLVETYDIGPEEAERDLGDFCERLRSYGVI